MKWIRKSFPSSGRQVSAIAKTQRVALGWYEFGLWPLAKGTWVLLTGGTPVLQQVGSDAGAGCEDEGGDAGLGEVALLHLGGDVFDIGGAAEGDRGASEASAGHAGAEDTAFEADLLSKGNHEVEFIARDLEVIAQGAVGAFHEGADVGEISAFEGLDRFNGAGDFGDDVAPQ